MSKPLRGHVEHVLAEHGRGEKIREAFEHANAVVNAMAKSPTWRRKGTRRAMFWEEAIEKLIELTADDPHVHVVEHHDTISFIFDDAVLVRLKKASLSLQTSNYPTELAQLFGTHAVDLFGYKGLQRVEAVYIPNQWDTEIVWTGIVARDNGKELWNFELAGPAAAPTAALPSPLAAPADELAKVKDSAKDRKKRTGGV